MVPNPINGSATWDGLWKDWVYINIATGGTTTVPTGRRVLLPFASPYKLVNHYERDNLLFKGIFDNISVPFIDYPIYPPAVIPFNKQYPAPYYTVQGMEYHASMMSYLMAGKDSDDDYETTDFHLIFCEDEDLLFPTIYTKFHKSKYDSLRNGYILKAKMRMNENDWEAMDISRTIKYRDELYRLVSIKNYDPILRTADIELLKKT